MKTVLDRRDGRTGSGALFLSCLLILGVIAVGCGGGDGGGSSTSASGSGTSTTVGEPGVTGSLFGTVVNASGLPIPGSRLILSNRGVAIATATADASGKYSFPGVPAEVNLTLDIVPPVSGIAATRVDVRVLQNERLEFQARLASVVPIIVTSSPVSGDTNVPTSIQPRVSFNVPIDVSSITTGALGSVRLTRISPAPSIPIDGTADTSFDSTGRSVVFKPRFPLTEGTTYFLALSTQIRDQFGTAFRGANIGFQTEGAARTGTVTSARVISSLPAAGATNVSPDTSLLFTFDRAMNSSTVNTQTVLFIRENPSSPVIDPAGKVEVFPSIVNTFKYTPSLPLTLASTFALSLSDEIRDTEGVRSARTTIRFTMRVDGPRIIGSLPFNGQENVATTQSFIQVAFDETLLTASALRLSNYSLTFQPLGGGIASVPLTAVRTLTSPRNSVQLTVGAPLNPNAVYTLAVNNIQDKDGNFQVPGQFFSFTTTNLGDNTPPIVLASTPANSQADASLDSVISVTWSEPMGVGVTLSAAYDFISSAGTVGIARVDILTGVANTFRLTPRVLPLQPLTDHLLVFRPELLVDSVGNQTISTGISFRTAAGNANLVDRVGSSPQDGDQQFQPQQNNGLLLPRFTRRMVLTTIENVNNYTLTESPATRVAINFAQSADNGQSVVLRPAVALKPNTNYSLAFSTALRAQDGTNMPANTTLLFKTGAFGDVNPPQVVSTFPSPGTSRVAVSTLLQVTYSEPMGPTATDPLNYFISNSLEPPYTPATAVLLPAPPNTVQFTLPRPLKSVTNYFFTVTNLIKDVAGNALPDPFSAAFSTTTTAGGSQQQPQLISSNPFNGATEVSTGTAIILQFNQEMNEGQNGFASSVFNAANFTLASEQGLIPLTVEPAAIGFNTYRLRPTQSLRGNSDFNFLISNNIVDRFNTPLAPANFRFTTANIGDTQPPQLVNTVPTQDQINVSPSTGITLFFSEEMDVISSQFSAINVSNYALFTSTGLSVPLSSTVAQGPGLRNSSFVLRPLKTLANSTIHTLVVDGNLRDITGNRLGESQQLSFTTVGIGDTGDVEPPQVESTNPANGTGSIAPSTLIAVTFSEPMRISSVVNPASYVLSTANGSIAITQVTTADSPANTYLLKPAALVPGADHTLLFTSALTDVAGNALTPSQLQFQVADTADRTPPDLLLTNPGDGTDQIDANAPIFLVFSEPMNAATVQSVSNYIFTTSGGEIPLVSVVAASTPPNTFIVTPPLPMLGGTEHRLTVTSRITDANGLPFNNRVIAFTTAAVPGGPGDVTAPAVVQTNPGDTSQNVGVNTLILITFSEGMNVEPSGSAGFGSSVLNPSNFIVKSSGNPQQVPGVKITQVNSPANTFAINVGTLDLNSLYTIQLSDRIKDTAGNALGTFQFSFFTGLSDTTAPAIAATGFIGSSSSFIQFTERMENSSVLNVNNYQVAASCTLGGTIPTVTALTGIPGTTLPGSSQRDITAVRIDFSGPFPTGIFTVFLSPLITDLAGNPIAAGNAQTITVGTCP